MAYVKQSTEQKALKKEITRLMNIQKAPLWGSFMRAICYPHKGLTHSHTYLLKEWYIRLVNKDSEDTFFEWAELYRQHCDALPLSRKGGRSKEIGTAGLFTKEMFYHIATNNIQEFNRKSEDTRFHGYAVEGQESVAETRARLTHHLYGEVLMQTVYQYLAPLINVDVYLPQQYSPTLEEVLSIYTSLGLDQVVCGILVQKEDRPFRSQASKDPRWMNAGYVFTDPLTPHEEGDQDWKVTWPQDFNQELTAHIALLQHQVVALEQDRVSTITANKRKVGRPVHSRPEQSTDQTGSDTE